MTEYVEVQDTVNNQTLYYTEKQIGCPCDEAHKRGIVMMCFVCTGPQTIRTYSHSSKDLE